MKEKKKDVATPGFEPSSRPTSENVRRLTTRPCDLSKLIALKYFSLPFTLFEPYGAVFYHEFKDTFEEK